MKPIDLPYPDPRRQLARRLLDAGAGLAPGGALLTAVFSVTHPEHAELLQRAWQENITNTVNELIEKIVPTIKLSDIAIEFARELALRSKVGIGGCDFIEHSDIHSSLTKFSPEEIDSASGELELERLIEVQRFIGGGSILAAANSLFWMFDPLAFPDADPNADAMRIADEILRFGQVHCADFSASEGWSPRRFNPAMTLLLQTVGESGFIVSQTIDPKFVTPYVRANDLGKAKLRREFKLQ